MTPSQTTWVPIETCTLPTLAQPMRVAEFDDLFARHLRAVERVGPGHARLTLVGAPGLAERVEQLAARESGCCSFFGFTVTPAEAGTCEDGSLAGVVLDIVVPESRRDVLAALIERAEAARAEVTGS